MSVIFLNIYMYNKNDIKISVGDVLCKKGIIVKKVIKINKDSVTVISLSKRTSTIKFYDLQFYKIYKQAELTPKSFIGCIYSNGIINKMFIVNKTNDSLIFYCNEIIGTSLGRRIDIDGTLWEQQTLHLNSLEDIFIIKLEGALPNWYYKIDETKKKEISAHIKSFVNKNLYENSNPNHKPVCEAIYNIIKTGKIVNHRVVIALYIKNSRPQVCIPSPLQKTNIFTLFLQEDWYFHIIPRLRRIIAINDIVKYVGNKINITGLSKINWTVAKITPAKDNHALDQCLICYEEHAYIVFRKELKLIRKKKNAKII
jgi:hypothetical protein